MKFSQVVKAQKWGGGEEVYRSLLSSPSVLGGGGAGQRHATPHYPLEWPDTPCVGGWVESRAGLDSFGKSRPYRDSIPGPSSP